MQEYYEKLMETKGSEQKDREQLLIPFKHNPISKQMANGLDDLISIEEVQRAIIKTKWGKVPGPDGLYTEAYKCNEDLFAPILTERPVQ